MQDARTEAKSLQGLVNESLLQLNYSALQQELNGLVEKSNQPQFWNDQKDALITNKKISKIKTKINSWQDLKRQLDDLVDLIGLEDESMVDEIKEQLSLLKKEYRLLEKGLLYSGKYDDHDAIIGIYAGTGGTDAQDWAEMLLRMYNRWAEAQPDLKVSMINQTFGEEAGIKSATLEIEGPLAYGKLKGEMGVHRLVRLSPFNANNLRQTSFAKIEVLPKIDQPDEVLIDEKAIKMDVFRAGGHGGQSVNTTDSAVRITHLPTGITVTIQNERSQIQNKETALTILRSRLAQLQLEQHKEKVDDIKGPNEQASWGNQIRSYVLHPYNLVKDLRTRHETSDTQAVLNGKIDSFISAYLEWNASRQK
jgi:peptide chain release factor 2